LEAAPEVFLDPNTVAVAFWMVAALPLLWGWLQPLFGGDSSSDSQYGMVNLIWGDISVECHVMVQALTIHCRSPKLTEIHIRIMLLGLIR